MAETGKKTIHDASTRAFALFGAAFFLVFQTFFLDLTLADSDTAWHLAAGRLILESGIPQHDSWSFTTGDTIWYNLSWLFDAIIAWLQHYGGMTALHLLALFSGSAVFGGALFLAARQGAAIPAIILTALPLALYLPQSITMRPQLITLLGALVCYALLSRQGKLFVIPLLVLPWANMHGGVLLIFPMLAAYGAEALIKKDWRRAFRLALCGLACLLALLCNPWGVDVFAGMHRTLGGEARYFVDEWKAPQLGKDIVPTLWLALSVFAVFPRSISWADRFLAIGFGALAMTSLRHVMPWMLLSLPAISLGMSRIGVISKIGETMRHDLSKPRSYQIAQGCMAGALCLAINFMGTGMLLQKTPEKEIVWLSEQRPGARVFNAYNYGGMIIERGSNLKVFVDGRAETAYPVSVLSDYRRFHFMEKGWQDLPDTYNADAILFPKASAQVAHFRAQSGWREAFTGDVATVLVREGGKP